MRKSLISEVLYFIITIVIALIAFHLIFDLLNIRTEKRLSINIHDTYFVIEKMELLPIFILIVLYFSYLVKVCIKKFKNLQTLWIFTIISLIIVLICPSILAIVKSFATEPGWIKYPPLSSQRIEVKENMFNKIYRNLYFAFIGITTLGFYVFFKLGKLYNRNNS